MTTAVIVQARMSSTRLPGKVLAPVLGRPLLAYQLERLSRMRKAGALVLATTQEPGDDEVAEVAEAAGWHVTRGPEQDVLTRYWMACLEVDADVIVRSTADCPVIDPAIIDKMVAAYERSDCDYLTDNTIPEGMGAEVFSRRLLETMTWEAADPFEREHVTLFALRRPERFRLRGVKSELDGRWWTVDTSEDLAFITRVIEALYPIKPDFTLADIEALLVKHPEWRAINEASRLAYRDVRGRPPAAFA